MKLKQLHMMNILEMRLLEETHHWKFKQSTVISRTLKLKTLSLHCLFCLFNMEMDGSFE